MGRGGTEAPASTSGRGAGSKGSEQMESAQALLLDAQHHDTEVHNKALAAAFARSQAAAHSQWDLL